MNKKSKQKDIHSSHGDSNRGKSPMKYLFLNGKYKPVESEFAYPMMQSFNYGTAAFEGMKAYYRKKDKSWFLFRPDEHYNRFKRAAALLDIKLDFDKSGFVKIISRLIRKNNIKSDIYVRPIVYRDCKGVGLTRPSGYGFSIFIQSTPPKTPRRFSCCLVSQRRPVDGTYRVKLVGNYLLSYFAQKEAAAKKFDLGILLSTEGYLSEASLMNLFFVKNGKVFTPSLDCGPLDGITRKSVINIIRDQLGLRVFEGKYRRSRLENADEIFLTGTGSGINFIGRLGKRKFNLKKSGLIADQVWSIYKDIIYGKTDLYNDWLVEI